MGLELERRLERLGAGSREPLDHDVIGADCLHIEEVVDPDPLDRVTDDVAKRGRTEQRLEVGDVASDPEATETPFSLTPSSRSSSPPAYDPAARRSESFEGAEDTGDEQDGLPPLHGPDSTGCAGHLARHGACQPPSLRRSQAILYVPLEGAPIGCHQIASPKLSRPQPIGASSAGRYSLASDWSSLRERPRSPSRNSLTSRRERRT